MGKCSCLDDTIKEVRHRMSCGSCLGAINSLFRKLNQVTYSYSYRTGWEAFTGRLGLLPAIHCISKKSVFACFQKLSYLPEEAPLTLVSFRLSEITNWPWDSWRAPLDCPFLSCKRHRSTWVVILLPVDFLENIAKSATYPTHTIQMHASEPCSFRKQLPLWRESQTYWQCFFS